MKTLITESHGISLAALKTLCRTGAVVAADLHTREELISAVADADVLWVRLRHYLDAELMDAAPRLTVIATPTTGLTHIDLEAAADRGVRIISLRGESEFLREVHATAEHAVGLALALLRHLPAAVGSVKQGEWNRDAHRGVELGGRTVGIVGFGRLGKMTARYFQAFGCRIYAAERQNWTGTAEPGVNLVSLEQLLAVSEIVSIHASLDESSQGFFGQSQFEQMRPGSWLINTARGELVDEAAMLEALKSGRLAGAALDVLADEHLIRQKENPLIEYAKRRDNLLITPHIGGCTAESMAKTEEFLAQRVAAFCNDMALAKVISKT